MQKKKKMKREESTNLRPKIPMKILFHHPPALPSIYKSYDPKSVPKNLYHNKKRLVANA